MSTAAGSGTLTAESKEMRLELTGRHVDITPAIRRLVDTKLARLDRMLKNSALSAQVVLTEERRGRRADVTLHARGEKFLHGVGRSAGWQTCMTEAIDKIVQQAQRVKGKWQERKRDKGARVAAPAAEVPQAAVVRPAERTRPDRSRMPKILRASRQVLRLLSVSDALREADANGEGVVVFRDAETSSVSVLYRRADGELILVETRA